MNVNQLVVKTKLVMLLFVNQKRMMKTKEIVILEII